MTQTIPGNNIEDDVDKQANTSGRLGASITKTASKQTYYTIRFIADHERAADAYRAYGYFRWVDDVIDEGSGSPYGDDAGAERIAFVERQKSILEACYRGDSPRDATSQEMMLVDLIRNDTERNSGLQIYLRNMMDVMVFDAGRRGRVVSQAELFEYSHKLAKAVTEALYYFIGHDDPSPPHEARYLAVHAAHITHMLRDAQEDVENGYFNIPREHLEACGISPHQVNSQAYRDWVCGRVQFARGYFKVGRECTAQVKNWRLRLAGYAYTARFAWMLDAIERDNYCLRSEYPERKGFAAGLWMAWHTITSMFTLQPPRTEARKLASQPVRFEKR
ncbi:MAG: squalene/phytoene synthase family protein [Anaerolineales bacterium]|nr:MAG: squalene/phytoene synthase family protein [Anaerolineales bacterium]